MLEMKEELSEILNGEKFDSLDDRSGVNIFGGEKNFGKTDVFGGFDDVDNTMDWTNFTA